MGEADKKLLKAAAKLAKKQAKAGIKARKKGVAPPPAPRAAGEKGGGAAGPSPAVRYAEFVRGALYVILGFSLVLALILGERGVILSLDDLIDSLFAVWAGRIVLALIALALFVYGLKHLRLVR